MDPHQATENQALLVSEHQQSVATVTLGGAMEKLKQEKIRTSTEMVSLRILHLQIQNRPKLPPIFFTLSLPPHHQLFN